MDLIHLGTSHFLLEGGQVEHRGSTKKFWGMKGGLRKALHFNWGVYEKNVIARTVVVRVFGMRKRWNLGGSTKNFESSTGVYEKFSLQKGEGSTKIFRLLQNFDLVPPPQPIINEKSLMINVLWSEVGLLIWLDIWVAIKSFSCHLVFTWVDFILLCGQEQKKWPQAVFLHTS